MMLILPCYPNWCQSFCVTKNDADPSVIHKLMQTVLCNTEGIYMYTYVNTFHAVGINTLLVKLSDTWCLCTIRLLHKCNTVWTFVICSSVKGGKKDIIMYIDLLLTVMSIYFLYISLCIYICYISLCIYIFLIDRYGYRFHIDRYVYRFVIDCFFV